jgi:hypothetical protein
MLASVTAPAFAASLPCLASHAAMQPTDTVVGALAFSSSSITAALAYESFDDDYYALSDATPGQTGEIHRTPYTPAWDYIKLHHPVRVDGFGNLIILTIEFSAPVRNLSLTITDIDDDNSATGQSAPSGPVDWVAITPGPSITAGDGGFSVSQRGASVVGAGSATSPFTSNTKENIETSAGDVTLVWSGPLTIVTVAYKEADLNNVGEQGRQVGVGKISFDNC